MNHKNQKQERFNFLHPFFNFKLFHYLLMNKNGAEVEQEREIDVYKKHTFLRTLLI